MDCEIRILDKDERGGGITEELLILWEDSVRASHGFLADGDVDFYRPMVKEALSSIPLLAAAFAGGRAAGFFGVSGDRLEMLFTAPEFLGSGLGGRLMETAVSEYGVRSVEVKEQNTRAKRFYEKYGFRVAGISETGGCGRPHPIRTLELPL